MLGSIVINVPDIDAATDFWVKALQPNYELVHRDHNSATFFPSTGPGTGIALQFNTVDQTHFDLNIDAPDGDLTARDAEVERLLAIGATRVDWPHRDDVVVLADPNGFRFCVIG